MTSTIKTNLVWRVLWAALAIGMAAWMLSLGLGRHPAQRFVAATAWLLIGLAWFLRPTILDWRFQSKFGALLGSERLNKWLLNAGVALAALGVLMLILP